MIFLFVAVFAVTLLALAPVGLALRLAGLEAAGVAHERAAGTIWSGDLAGVSLRGQPLGRVTFQARPGALISGRMAYDVAVSGEIGQGRAIVIAGLDMRGVEDLVGDINVQALRRLDPRLRRVPARISLSIREIHLTGVGDCQAASGGLRTDLLARLGERWRWAGPALVGRVTCEGGDLMVRLDSAEGEDIIQARLQVNPARLEYALRASVETSNPGVQGALRNLEFTRSESGAFVYTQANTPRDATREETAS